MSVEFEPKVSIVIPVYNGANYMKDAIDSALAQTYKNIEVIVVNDGSTDSTDKIALSYGERIRYFSKINGGVATALNLAIEKADGDFISWLSHDDLYYPHKIKRQIEEVKKTSKEDRIKTIIFSHFDILDANNNNKYKISPLEYFNSQEPLSTYFMLDVFFCSKMGGCTLLIPRLLFENIGYFDVNQKTIQDYFLFIRFFKAGIKYRYVNEELVTSRHHKEQDTLRLMPLHLKELNYLYRWAFDLFKEDFQKMPLWQFEKFLNVMKLRTLDNVYAYMISEWANGDWNHDKPIIWLYWENMDGRKTPDVIRLCWKTIINHNKYDFKIKILTEDDIPTYLPNINQNYKLYPQIAHRADYIRFNLLYLYGGIWLDSDTIIFRNLNEVKEKIKDHGFACTGYFHERGKIFPTIGFLASIPKNNICLKIIREIEAFIQEKLINGMPQEWDNVGWQLSDILNNSNESFYVYPIESFCPYKVYASDNSIFEIADESACNLLLRTDINSYGQSIANSVRSEKFNQYTEAELLNLDGLVGSMFRLGYNWNFVDNIYSMSSLEIKSGKEKLDHFFKLLKIASNNKIIRNIIVRIFYPVLKAFYRLSRGASYENHLL